MHIRLDGVEAKSGNKLIVCLDVIPIRCTKKQGQNNGTIVSAFAFISCLLLMGREQRATLRTKVTLRPVKKMTVGHK